MDIKCPNLYYSDPSDPFPFKGNQLKACIEYLYYLKSADDITISNLRNQPNSTCFSILFINIKTNTTYEIPIIRSKIQEAIIQVELKMDQEAKEQSETNAELKNTSSTSQLIDTSLYSEEIISTLMSTPSYLLKLKDRLKKIADSLKNQAEIANLVKCNSIEMVKKVESNSNIFERIINKNEKFVAWANNIENKFEELIKSFRIQILEIIQGVKANILQGMMKSNNMNQEVLKFDRNLQRNENSDLDVIKKKQKLNEESSLEIESGICKQVDSDIPYLVKVEKNTGKLDFDHFYSIQEFVEEDLEFIVVNSQLRPVDRNAKKEKLIEEVKQGCKMTKRVFQEVKQIIRDNYIVINQVLWNFIPHNERILTIAEAGMIDWHKLKTGDLINLDTEAISNEAKIRLEYKYESWEEMLRLSYFCSRTELMFFIENVIGCKRSQIRIYLTLDYPKRITGLKADIGIEGNFFNWFYRQENSNDSSTARDYSDRSEITEHSYYFFKDDIDRIINMQYFQHVSMKKVEERRDKNDYPVLESELI